MKSFEQEPNDPKTYMEELKLGKFSMSDEEKGKIVKEALAAGKDPDGALRDHQARLDRANAHLRERDREKAIKDLEKETFTKNPEKER